MHEQVAQGASKSLAPMNESGNQMPYLNGTRISNQSERRMAHGLWMIQNGYTYDQAARVCGWAHGQSARAALSRARSLGVAANDYSAIWAFASSMASIRNGATGASSSAFVENLTTLDDWTRRSFGVELETENLSADAMLAALENAGLQVRDEGYTHRRTTWWKVVRDASCGMEAVSPVLYGDEGWDEVEIAMKALKDAGAQIRLSCGTHIHLGTDDMPAAALVRMVKFYVANQGFFDALTSPSRRINSLLSGWTQRQLDEEMPMLERRVVPNNDNWRYRTINTQSMNRHTTLEFRQHQGTLNREKMQKWGLLLMACMKLAKEDKLQFVPTIARNSEGFTIEGRAGAFDGSAAGYRQRKVENTLAKIVELSGAPSELVDFFSERVLELN